MKSKNSYILPACISTILAIGFLCVGILPKEIVGENGLLWLALGVPTSWAAVYYIGALLAVDSDAVEKQERQQAQKQEDALLFRQLFFHVLVFIGSQDKFLDHQRAALIKAMLERQFHYKLDDKLTAEDIRLLGEQALGPRQTIETVARHLTVAQKELILDIAVVVARIGGGEAMPALVKLVTAATLMGVPDSGALKTFRSAITLN